MKNTGSSFEMVFEKTIKVFTRGNFLYFMAMSIREFGISDFTFMIDFLRNKIEETIMPEINDINKEIVDAFIIPIIIIKIWVEAVWYTLARENSLKFFPLTKLDFIISKAPKKNTPTGIIIERLEILSALR